MSEDADFLSRKFGQLNLEGARILITGSSGLIGKNLIAFFNAILNKSNQKFYVDAISSSMDLSEKLHPNIHKFTADLTRGIENIGLSNYDYIFHAATYGQPSKFVAKPIETLILNGPLVIELANKLNPLGTFVFLSTSEIYSGSPIMPNTETDLGNLSIDNPRAPYVYGKLFGEVALMQLRDIYRVRIARIALAYGPGTKLNDERVLNQFIQRGVMEKKIELRDSGDAIRTYCYIRDSLEMLLNVAFKACSEVYNIGATTETTIRDLGKEISELLGIPFNAPLGNPSYLNAPKGVKLDVSKYDSEFGKIQYLELREGLTRTIQWQREQLFSKPGRL